MSQVTFYFDLGSPFAYLSAERLHEVLPDPVHWQPVSLGALFKLNGRSSWSLGDATRRQTGIADVEERARQYGLAPIRWPDPWPANYLFAMRAAIFAFQVGQGREFTMSAFRHAFLEGHDLGLPEHVLQAAAEVGLDARAVEDATRDPEVKLALRSATGAAHERGVSGVPTVAIDDELFWGDDRLQDAAAAFRERAVGRRVSGERG